MPINLSSGSDYDSRENVPTIRQYLKTLGRKKLSPRYLINVIWKPNQFSNFTFETESFRVRIKCNSALGKVLRNVFAEWEESEPVLAIEITDRDSGAFNIIDLPEERASWEGLGENGWRIKILDRRE